MDAQAPGDSNLLSQVHADLESRWQRGEAARVEDYFQRYPELEQSPQHLLELVYAEVRQREQKGETPVLAEYQARFPRFAGAIEMQWRLHGLVGGGLTAELTVPATSAQDGTAPLAPTFQGLVLLGELGGGGMGVVYKARQLDLDRVVAVKMVRPALAGQSQALARFHTEARAVARLGHPGVVQIYHFAEHRGALYLIMEYLPGGNLAQRLRDGPLPPEQAARLVAKLARAVQAAHEAQVIHRDLKPSNVLLTADGEPKVSDFGLAKLLDADAEQTRTGVVMGTPSFMAPEQADGAAAGPAADVWAMGAILYQCLAGRLPFTGATGEQVLRAVRTGHPQPPHPPPPLGPTPAALAAVCLACLRKSPQDRYPTAAALAEDLERWLAGRRVKPPTRRWTRRAVLAAAGAGLLGAALTPVALWRLDPDRERRRIDRDLDAGREVVLLEGGPPRWHRWVVGKEGAEISRARDGAFAIHAWTFSMLELARPAGDRYRLSAEIRHEKGAKPCQVGLFFALRHLEDGDVRAPFFLHVSFDDYHDVGERRDRVLEQLGNDVPDDLKGKPRPLNVATLSARLHLGSGWVGGGMGSDLADFGSFQASKGIEPPWRRLVVEATPERIRAWMGEDEKGAATANPAAVARHVNVSLRQFLAAKAQLSVPSPLPLAGGIGLIVDDGVASFRRVVLTRLPAPPNS